MKMIKENLKTVLLTFIMVASIGISNVNAQRFVYVDMDYILENLPEYQKAQKELDKMAETWRAEISVKMQEVETSYKRFQAEQVLMNEKMKAEKIADIETKEKEIKDLQRKRFGQNGDLFQKRQELIKPIQDKIYKQIQLLAEEKSYDFIFDKSSGIQMLFANKKYDKSAFILAALKK